MVLPRQLPKCICGVPDHIQAPERFLVAAGLASPLEVDAGDIPDPYTGTREDFREVLALIRRGVHALALRLPDAGRKGTNHDAR